jgi:hypothetical protein
MRDTIAAPPQFYTGAGTYILGIDNDKIVAAERISVSMVAAECADPHLTRITPTIVDALAAARAAATKMPSSISIKLALGSCCEFRNLADLPRSIRISPPDSNDAS